MTAGWARSRRTRHALFKSYTTRLVFLVKVLRVHVPVNIGHILHRGVLFRSPFKTFSPHVIPAAVFSLSADRGADRDRTSLVTSPMSALTSKADIDQRARDVRFVPKAAVSRCSK